MKTIILPLEPLASGGTKTLAVADCGLVLPWVQAWDGSGSLKDYLEGRHGFPLHEMSGGSVDADGVYSYPEDAALKPLVKVEFESCTFYQYFYGILAIVSPEGTYITRMD